MLEIVMAANSPFSPPPFVHRKNLLGDGYISICTVCAATAARASQEKDLERAEQGHVCEHPILKKPPASAD